MERNNPSLRWLILLVLIWPIVVVGLSSVTSLMFHRQAGQKYDAQQASKDSPVAVVQALWIAQDNVIDNWRQLKRPQEFAAILSKSAILANEQNECPYSERQIDSDRKLDADRWQVKATLTLSPPYREDEESITEDRAYIVVKDRGKWKVSEVRAGCTSCEGKGYDSCFMCDGKGRDYDGSPCDECHGAGKLKCKACKGVGWIDLLRVPGGMGRY